MQVIHRDRTKWILAICWVGIACCLGGFGCSPRKPSVGPFIRKALADSHHLVNAVGMEDYPPARMNEALVARNDKHSAAWVAIQTPIRKLYIPKAARETALVVLDVEPYRVVFQGAESTKEWRPLAARSLSTRPTEQGPSLGVEVGTFGPRDWASVPAETREISFIDPTNKPLRQLVIRIVNGDDEFEFVVAGVGVHGQTDDRKSILESPRQNWPEISEGLEKAGVAQSEGTKVIDRARTQLLTLADEGLFLEMIKGDKAGLSETADTDSAVRCGLVLRLASYQWAPVPELERWCRRIHFRDETLYVVEEAETLRNRRAVMIFGMFAFDDKGAISWRGTVHVQKDHLDRDKLLSEIVTMIGQ